MGSADAVAILVDTDRPADDQTGIWTYIRSGEMTTPTDIPDGEYQVYITARSSWNPVENRFQNSAEYEKLEGSLDFSSNAKQYSSWQLELRSSTGDTGLQSVPESDFPNGSFYIGILEELRKPN